MKQQLKTITDNVSKLRDQVDHLEQKVGAMRSHFPNGVTRSLVEIEQKLAGIGDATDQIGKSIANALDALDTKATESSKEGQDDNGQGVFAKPILRETP